jgi:cysteine desulfurase family protein (TIGR01976 family)
MTLSIPAIRAHFPALTRQHGGYPVAYFDGPGGTQTAVEVVEAMRDYLLHHNANTHWIYPTSQETDALLAEARASFADFFHCQPDEVSFGNNMTTITFHVSRALGRGWHPGDEIVVTELDHHANVDPWREMARDRGLTVRTVRLLTESGQLDWEDLEEKLTSRTKLLAIGAASNALGTINDIARAARLAHQVGALVFVDAVHYAPHQLVDVRELGCDLLACSAYKFYGPHLGILYGRRAILEQLDVPKLAPASNEAPDRLETGTQNHEGIVGAAAAVNLIASWGRGETRRERLVSAMAALHDQGDRLLRRLWDGLHSIEGVSVYGPTPDQPRTPTVSFCLRDVPAVELAAFLATRGLFVSHGDFYAQTVVDRLGKAEQGLLRIGCSCYTSEEEIERLLEGIRAFPG